MPKSSIAIRTPCSRKVRSWAVTVAASAIAVIRPVSVISTMSARPGTPLAVRAPSTVAAKSGRRSWRADAFTVTGTP